VAVLETVIGFNPDRLAFLDASAGSRPTTLLLTATPQGAGQIHLALSGASGTSIAAGTGEIAVLRFRVDHFAAAGDTAELPFSLAQAHDTGACRCSSPRPPAS